MMSMLEQDRWSLFERGQVLTFDTINNIGGDTWLKAFVSNVKA